MLADTASRIRSNPYFVELEAKRGRFGWWLTAIMLVIYYGFILLVAFAKGFLGIKIGDSVITIAFPIGIGVILAAILITGIYVLRANGEFDRLTRLIEKGEG
jgi:uncharacterized membrane protein (DUF485 family)